MDKCKADPWMLRDQSPFLKLDSSELFPRRLLLLSVGPPWKEDQNSPAKVKSKSTSYSNLKAKILLGSFSQCKYIFYKHSFNI